MTRRTSRTRRAAGRPASRLSARPFTGRRRGAAPRPASFATALAAALAATVTLTAVAAGVLLLAAARAEGRTCREVKAVCADSADRVIDGGTVSRDCWRWERTYACTEPSPERGRCEPENIPPACTVTGSSCTSESGGECLEKTADLLCRSRPEGPGITAGEPRVSVVFTTARTPGLPLGEGCTVSSRTCLDAAPREIPVGNLPGETVTAAPACWRERLVVSCPSAAAAESCRRLEEAGCRPAEDAGRTCAARNEAGACTSWSATYVCRDRTVEGGGITPGASTAVPDGGSREDDSACREALGAQAAAGFSCRETERTCLKPGGDGEPDCLLWERRHACTAPGADGCATLEALARPDGTGDCRLESGPDCTERDDDGRCLSSSAVYRCGKDVSPGDAAPPPEALPDAVGEAEVPVDDCGALREDAACVETASTCIEGPAVKLVDGVPVRRDCWRTQHVWTCRTGAPGAEGECAALAADPGCRLVSETCPDGEADCARPTRVYACTRSQPDEAAGTVCSGEACIAGVCAPTDDEPDRDFAAAIVGMEIAREAGVYGDVSGNRFFSGVALGCRDRRGASSCCRSDAPAGTSNDAFALWLDFGTGATMEAVRWLGSPYVHDVLAYSEHTSGLLDALYGGASGAYGPAFSHWGATLAWTEAGGWSFDFSPGGFALAAAMHFYGAYSSCRAEDQRVALMKGERLCHYVGTVCTNRTPGLGCTETEERYVCFNSRLARILNEEGRRQLGRGWGTAEHPDGRGFTVEELGALDFARMDLTEFVADVVREALSGAGDAEGDLARRAERAKERVTAALEDRIAKFGPMPGPSGTSRTDRTAAPAGAGTGADGTEAAQ